MPSQSDLVVSLKSLAYLALIVPDSQASPILRSISGRDMGITSPNEDRMTIKVGYPTATSATLESGFPNPVTVQNTLEWLFAAAAVLIIAAGFAWR